MSRSLAGDSGFSILKYGRAGLAKKGLISRREFDKLYMLMAPRSMIAACKVACGRRHDLPGFYECMLDGDRARVPCVHMPDEITG